MSIEHGVQFTGAKLTLAMKTLAATARTNPLKRDQDRVDARRLILAMPEVTATDLEPLWQALRAPGEVRDTFERLRAEAQASVETDADDFY